MAVTPNWANEVNPLLTRSMEDAQANDLASPPVLDQDENKTLSMELLQKQIEHQHLE